MQRRAAKSLHPGQVGQQLGGAVKRLVHLEEVRVTVHQHHLPAKLLSMADDLGNEVAVATEAGLQALIHLFGFGQVKAGVGLEHQHHAPRVGLFGGGKGLLQPAHVGSVALQIFGVGSIALGGITGALVRALLHIQNHVVVAAGHIKARKHHAAVAEARVFHILFAQLALVLQRHLGLAQAALGREHHPADVGQALQTIEAAVVQAVAIGPFVVTGNVDHGFDHAAKHGEGIGVNAIRALGAAVLNVAVVEGERDVRLVDAFQNGGQLGVVTGFFVGHVAP